MSPRKEDIWADLRYALDELNRPIEKGTYDRLPPTGLFSPVYPKAKMRANTRIAHEAIEKGLKAILLDSGLTGTHMRSRGHQLHRLLADVKQHNPAAFNELERCFDSVIQFLGIVTPIQHNTDILEYFRKHGKAEVLIASRYASIESTNNMTWGMIGLVYMELIRALLSLIFGWTPKDINHRIEEAAEKAVLAERKHDPTWDAVEWLNQGPVRPRLEVIKTLKNNRVLRLVLRRCARDHNDRGIQSWASNLRRTTSLREGGRELHIELAKTWYNPVMASIVHGFRP